MTTTLNMQRRGTAVCHFERHLPSAAAVWRHEGSRRREKCRSGLSNNFPIICDVICEGLASTYSADFRRLKSAAFLADSQGCVSKTRGSARQLSCCGLLLKVLELVSGAVFDIVPPIGEEFFYVLSADSPWLELILIQSLQNG